MSAMTPVLQSQAAECSLACLAMVASAHGHQVSLQELRQRFSLSLKGANLQQLIGYAAALGLAARPVRLELEELSQLPLPSILHWDLNHFVVLQKIKGQQVTLLDPALGLRNISLATASPSRVVSFILVRPNCFSAMRWAMSMAWLWLPVMRKPPGTQSVCWLQPDSRSCNWMG